MTTEHLTTEHLMCGALIRRSVISASVEGLPLDDDQLGLFRDVAEQDPPRPRARELWVIAGRR
jgi:hypothetical protein